MHYLINGKVFSTKAEAEIYKQYLHSTTRKVYGIFPTTETVTHRFLLEGVA